jgi:L-lysine 2,3-aminomutase
MVLDKFPEKLTPYLKKQIKASSQIKKQFLVSPAEKLFSKGEKKDPLGEEKYSVYPFLLHKFKKRILLLLSNRCFANCRFCF